MSISFSAGQLITSNQMNLLAPVYTVKSTPQSVTDSATLVNDNDLVFTVVANQAVQISYRLGVTAGSTAPGIKTAYLLTGTVAVQARHGLGPASGTVTASTSTAMHAFMFNSTAAANYAADTGVATVWEDVVFTTGASGGTITLQWAQNTATVGVSTTLNAGSYAILRYVS